MESFLVLVSILTLGTVTVEPKPTEQPSSVAKTIELSKSYSALSKKETEEAPSKILELCKNEVKINYQDPKTDVIHYKCSGKDVMFFSVENRFYASLESSAVEEGFVLVDNERLSRSLSRQVRKMYQDASEHAKAQSQSNNTF